MELRAEFGTHQDVLIVVSNAGNDTLVVDSVVSTLPNITTHPTSFKVSPGGNFNDTIRFTPTLNGVQTGQLLFASNVSGVAETLAVQGYGFGTRVLTFSMDTLDFGYVRTGTSRDTVVQFTNTGSDTLRIVDIAITGDVFSTADTAFTLLPGESRYHHFQFRPPRQNWWQFQGNASFTWIDAAYIHDLILSGWGLESGIAFPVRSEIEFGDVRVSDQKTIPFPFMAAGSDTLNVDSVRSRSSTFAISGPEIFSVEPYQTDTLWMSFAPTGLGPDSTYVVIFSNDPESPDSVLAWGTGTTNTSVNALSEAIPKVYSLAQNYPNPINPSTSIRFGLPVRSHVVIDIYNVLGQKVVRVFDEVAEAGIRQILWDALVPSGPYLYRIDAQSVDNPMERFVDIKKMIFLR